MDRPPWYLHSWTDQPGTRDDRRGGWGGGSEWAKAISYFYDIYHGSSRHPCRFLTHPKPWVHPPRYPSPPTSPGEWVLSLPSVFEVRHKYLELQLPGPHVLPRVVRGKTARLGTPPPPLGFRPFGPTPVRKGWGSGGLGTETSTFCTTNTLIGSRHTSGLSRPGREHPKNSRNLFLDHLS